MRKTREDVEFYLDKVNNFLKRQGKDFYYIFTSRNGYKAIDKCYYYNSGASDYRSGLTTGEAYDIAYSLYTTLEDLFYENNDFEILKNASLRPLYDVCGYREFEILKTATYENIKIIMDNKDHKVLRITGDENSFDYDIKNKKIVG